MKDLPRKAKAMTRFVADDDGAGTVTGLFLFLIIVMIGGLAVDHANGVRTRAHLQSVADAAAMAGAAHLTDGENSVREASRALADRHQFGVLLEQDILIGTWTESRFTRSGNSTPNAVRVVTKRTEASGNPLRTFLIHLVGVDRLNVSAMAIAVRSRQRPGCSGGGYFARGSVVAHSSNQYLDGFCVHGEQSVQLHNVNYFEEGTVVSSPDRSNISGNRNNPGLEEAIRESSHIFSRAGELGGLFDSIHREGIYSDVLPSYISFGPVYLNRINSNEDLAPNTLYIVSGDVDLRGNRNINGVAVFASGNIVVRSNTELRDVILAAQGSITINNNTRIGGSEFDYCTASAYSSYLLSQSNIEINTNNQLRGILMAAWGNIVMNSNNEATEGVYAEALGDIVFNSSSHKQGCQTGLESELIYADSITKLAR